MMQTSDVKLSQSELKPRSRQAVPRLAVAAIDLDELYIADVPDKVGAPPLVSEQQEEAVRQFGAQVSGMLAPTLAALEQLEQKISRLKGVIVEREQLLLNAAQENSVFAKSACEHTDIIGAAVEKLAIEIEASVPTLPVARAA